MTAFVINEAPAPPHNAIREIFRLCNGECFTQPVLKISFSFSKTNTSSTGSGKAPTTPLPTCSHRLDNGIKSNAGSSYGWLLFSASITASCTCMKLPYRTAIWISIGSRTKRPCPFLSETTLVIVSYMTGSCFKKSASYALDMSRRYIGNQFYQSAA